MLDYLCDECAEHFAKVKELLTSSGLEYAIDPRIVRGLDYYTKTVFEFVSCDLGAQSTVLGGGRYDGLIQQMGAQPTPALGFAMGIERLMMIMAAQNCEFPEKRRPDIYIAPLGEKASAMAMSLCTKLRNEGFSALTDISGRSAKAQFKFADKVGALFTVAIGDDEIEKGVATLKNMRNGETQEVELIDGVINAVYKAKISVALADLNDSMEQFENC